MGMITDKEIEEVTVNNFRKAIDAAPEKSQCDHIWNRVGKSSLAMCTRCRKPMVKNFDLLSNSKSLF